MSNELLNLSAITSPLDSDNAKPLALINQGMEQPDSLIVPFQQQLIIKPRLIMPLKYILPLWMINAT